MCDGISSAYVGSVVCEGYPPKARGFPVRSGGVLRGHLTLRASKLVPRLASFTPWGGGVDGARSGWPGWPRRWSCKWSVWSPS